jgi:hypothetical protein
VKRPNDIPLSIRIIAILEIAVKTPVVLIGAFLAAWHHSTGLLLGFLVPARIAPLLFTLLIAGSLSFAIGTLRGKRWGLDGLTAYAVFGLFNAPLVLFSRARVAYEGMMARRLVSDSGISFERALHLQQVISTSIYVATFIIAAVCLYFLLTRRAAFRTACAAQNGAAQ